MRDCFSIFCSLPPGDENVVATVEDSDDVTIHKSVSEVFKDVKYIDDEEEEEEEEQFQQTLEHDILGNIISEVGIFLSKGPSHIFIQILFMIGR